MYTFKILVSGARRDHRQIFTTNNKQLICAFAVVFKVYLLVLEGRVDEVAHFRSIVATTVDSIELLWLHLFHATIEVA